jgi:hypothetical protein
MTDEREGLPSASAMYRVVSCPGSLALIESCKPPELTTSVAQQGTEIHAALESGETYALDEESQEIAEKLKQLEQSMIRDFVPDSMRDTEVYRETRLWVHDSSFNVVASAKSDVIFVVDDRPVRALVIDFKTGFLPVTPAEKNWQLRTQAVAVHQEYGATNIRVAVACARLGKPHVDFVDYTLEDLKNAERDLLFQLWKAKQPDAPRHAGEWCKYCPAKAYCREAAAWSAVEVVSPTQTVTTKEQIGVTVASMTPEQLVHVWRKRNIVEGVMDAIKARLKALPPEELESLGLRLKEGKRNREIVDKDGAFSHMIMESYFTELEIFSASKLSVQKLTECFQKQNPSYSNKDAQNFVTSMLAPYTHESRGEPTLEEIK